MLGDGFAARVDDQLVFRRLLDRQISGSFSLEDATHVDPCPVITEGNIGTVAHQAAGLDVLMVRRSEAMIYHGGAWVFPGGKVEAGERPEDTLTALKLLRAYAMVARPKALELAEKLVEKSKALAKTNDPAVIKKNCGMVVTKRVELLNRIPQVDAGGCTPNPKNE